MKYSEKVWWFWWTISAIMAFLIIYSVNMIMEISFFAIELFCICFGLWLSYKESEMEND